MRKDTVEFLLRMCCRQGHTGVLKNELLNEKNYDLLFNEAQVTHDDPYFWYGIIKERLGMPGGGRFCIFAFSLAMAALQWARQIIPSSLPHQFSRINNVFLWSFLTTMSVTTFLCFSRRRSSTTLLRSIFSLRSLLLMRTSAGIFRANKWTSRCLWRDTPICGAGMIAEFRNSDRTCANCPTSITASIFIVLV